MKLIGSKIEGSLRAELVASRDALFHVPSNGRLLCAIREQVADLKTAYVLHVVPDQGEDLVTVLPDDRVVVRAEVDRRTRNARVIEVIPLQSYSKRLRGRTAQLRLAVALDLLRRGQGD